MNVRKELIREHIIYGLIDPRDNIIKYVGVTSNLEIRLGQHKLSKKKYNRNIQYNSSHTVKEAWIEELYENELNFNYCILKKILCNFIQAEKEESVIIKKLNPIYNSNKNAFNFKDKKITLGGRYYILNGIKYDKFYDYYKTNDTNDI